MLTWNLKEHRWETSPTPELGERARRTARRRERAAPTGRQAQVRASEERERRVAEVVNALGGPEAVMEWIKSRVTLLRPPKTVHTGLEGRKKYWGRSSDWNRPKSIKPSEDKRIEILKYFIQHGHEESQEQISRRFSIGKGTMANIVQDAGLYSPWRTDPILTTRPGSDEVLAMSPKERRRYLGSVRRKMLAPTAKFTFPEGVDIAGADMTVTDFADYYRISEGLTRTLMDPRIPLPARISIVPELERIKIADYIRAHPDMNYKAIDDHFGLEKGTAAIVSEKAGLDFRHRAGRRGKGYLGPVSWELPAKSRPSDFNLAMDEYGRDIKALQERLDDDLFDYVRGKAEVNFREVMKKFGISQKDLLIGFFFGEEWPDPPVHNWANVYWNAKERKWVEKEHTSRGLAQGDVRWNVKERRWESY